MTCMKSCFLVLALQLFFVSANRVRVQEHLGAKLSTLTVYKCGYLDYGGVRRACYAKESNKTGKAACEGKCSFVQEGWAGRAHKESNGLFGWGSCSCSNAAQKCKSAETANPGLKRFIKQGTYYAVRVNTETKQWSYLKFPIPDGQSNDKDIFESVGDVLPETVSDVPESVKKLLSPPVWKEMGDESSLDEDQVIEPQRGDVLFAGEGLTKNKFKNVNGTVKEEYQDKKGQLDLCNPIVMGTYIREIQWLL